MQRDVTYRLGQHLHLLFMARILIYVLLFPLELEGGRNTSASNFRFSYKRGLADRVLTFAILAG